MAEELTRIKVEAKAQAYSLRAEAAWIGADLLVWIWGGVAHIGAVAMAQPRPSLADPQRTSATASVFAYVGHKEDEVAKRAAETLASALDAKVVVSAGMHWDNLPAEGIEIIKDLTRQLLTDLLARLSPPPASPDH